MPFPARISMGMHAYMTARERGIPISDKTAFILALRIARYSPKLLFIGTTNMKKTLLLICLLSPFAIAGQSDPVKQAVKFNQWYIGQITKDAFPITDGPAIDNFVTASTMKKLRHTQEANYGEKGEEFYDADLFLKSQYIGDDWEANVQAIAGDTDQVCVNVYIAFGKKQDHIVIDCMIKEGGAWKVQSLAAVQFSRNLADPK